MPLKARRHRPRRGPLQRPLRRRRRHRHRAAADPPARLRGRVATGTSLAAIGITALAGTILYAFEGHVHVGVRGASSGLSGRRAARWRGQPSSSASPGASLTLALRSAARHDRGLAARRMSATTVALGAPARLHRRRAGAASSASAAGSCSFRPSSRSGSRQLGAEATSAARDPADRRGRHVASAPVRERPVADGARARNRLDRAARRSASRSRRRCRKTPCGGCSRCFLLAVAAQLAWRSRRPAPYPSSA